MIYICITQIDLKTKKIKIQQRPTMHKFNWGESGNFKGLASNQGRCILIGLWFRNPQLNLC
jgi:hypothetical protein